MGRFAWLLATSSDETRRDPPAAIQLAHHACRLTNFENPQLLDTLAAAYAAAGRFDEAVAAATRARDFASAGRANDLAARIETRLNLYRSGRAFIATTQPAATMRTTQPISSPHASNPARDSGK
jgi:protein O-mannosyl-transferase